MGYNIPADHHGPLPGAGQMTSGPKDLDRQIEANQARALFLNMVRSLYNIGHDKLPELSDSDWLEFRNDPPRYYINTDNRQQRAIYREVLRRQG